MKAFEILISIMERYDKNSKNYEDRLSFNHKIDFSMYGRIDKKSKIVKRSVGSNG